MTELADKIVRVVQRKSGDHRLTEETILASVDGDDRSKVQAFVEALQSGALIDEKGSIRYVPVDQRQQVEGNDHEPEEPADVTRF